MPVARAVSGSRCRTFNCCQKLLAYCGNVLTSVKSFMQNAATIWQVSKASCKLQQRFDKCQKLPADCGNDLTSVKSFLQIAATIWQVSKASCRLRQRFDKCQKLPANCGKELAVFHALSRWPRKFLVLSGATSKVSHLSLLFFLYLLLDYRWSVSFDSYLRKKKNK